MTFNTRLTWSVYVNQVRKKAAHRFGVLGPSSTVEAACPSGTACCYTSSSSFLWRITHVRSRDPLPAAMSGRCKSYNQSVFALRLTHLCTLVTGEFSRICEFHSSPTTSEHWEFQLKLAVAGNPLLLQLGRHLCRPGLAEVSLLTDVNWCSAGLPRLSFKKQPSRCKGTLTTRLTWLRFTVLFLGYKANARI
jgi:hypothetical protein